MPKRKKLTVHEAHGSWSTATMIPEDIVSKIDSVLPKYLSNKFWVASRKAKRAVDKYGWQSEQAMDANETVSWILNEDIWDYMNSIAPEGMYFGASEGDGSDYGYWFSEEYIEENPNLFNEWGEYIGD
jgi:hypothetical protein